MLRIFVAFFFSVLVEDAVFKSIFRMICAQPAHAHRGMTVGPLCVWAEETSFPEDLKILCSLTVISATYN